MPNVMAALPNIGGATVQRCKVWLTPTTRVPCSNSAKTRNPLKSAWVPQTRQQSSALVGRSSPYYEDMWRKYRCLTSFFRLSIHALAAKIQPNKMAIFCVLYFSASRMQHISDMHSKFALKTHHMWKYGRHTIADR